MNFKTKILRSISIFAALFAILFASTTPQLAAQEAPDVSGTWQGTLQAGKGMRIVLKISKAGNGDWQGVFYNIDSSLSGHGRATTAMSLHGSDLNFTIEPIQGSYSGKLSSGGASLEGVWTQGGEAQPLNFVRATADTAWEIPKADSPMPPDAQPEFEVATVKPTDPSSNSEGFRSNGRRISCEGETVMRIISFAYNVHTRQIVGGPSWLESTKYTIDGYPDVDGVPNLKQMRGMYQRILADRFKLAFHRDKRELSVYAITVSKGGPKIQKSLGDPKGLPDQTGNWGGVRNGIRFTNNSMEDFANMLDYLVEKPVVDQTGLAGRFDFYLKWSSDEVPVNDPSAPPVLFTAVQEQLGLKLEPVKAPADVMVVDHIEPPSEN